MNRKTLKKRKLINAEKPYHIGRKLRISKKHNAKRVKEGDLVFVDIVFGEIGKKWNGCYGTIENLHSDTWFKGSVKEAFVNIDINDTDQIQYCIALTDFILIPRDPFERLITMGKLKEAYDYLQSSG